MPIMTLILKSPAFPQDGEIPSLYTCEGKDISPALEWSGAPAGTKSYVLIVDDPDAPDPKAPKITWVHWVLYNIPPDTNTISDGSTENTLPSGTKQGLNDWKRSEYGGPCPPIGRHRYFHKLYALDTTLKSIEALTKAEVESAMEGHVIASTELIGTYQKSK